MSLKIRIFVILMVLSFLSIAQNSKPLPGFPDRSPKLDVLPGFKTPPAGYGDVAFCWWVGDMLTKERLLCHLDELKNKKITVLRINYCHIDAGGATYGLTFQVSQFCSARSGGSCSIGFLKKEKRGTPASLSDYTLGAAGQG